MEIKRIPCLTKQLVQTTTTAKGGQPDFYELSKIGTLGCRKYKLLQSLWKINKNISAKRLFVAKSGFPCLSSVSALHNCVLHTWLCHINTANVPHLFNVFHCSSFWLTGPFFIVTDMRWIALRDVYFCLNSWVQKQEVPDTNLTTVFFSLACGLGEFTNKEAEDR